MPIYTIYALITLTGKRTHRTRNIAISSVHNEIVDFWDLKEQLLIAARAIYEGFNQQTVTEISLEKHLAGRYIRATTMYRESRIHFRRQPEFRATITYNPKTDTVQVQSASFITPEFYQKYKGDYDQDRGKKWTLPTVIEPGFEKKLHSDNLDMLFTELITVRTPNYTLQQKDLYGPTQQKQEQKAMYSLAPMNLYGSADRHIIEKDKAEKQNEF